MARTDIHGSPISCIKCKKGHRDISCNDSHPGPCFYRGKRGRPRKGEAGQVSGPLPVPDFLLRPCSGVPSGPSPPPTPPSAAVRYPHLGANGYTAFAAPLEASPWVSPPSSLDVPRQLPMAPPFLPTPPLGVVKHPHLGVNGFSASAAQPYFPLYVPPPPALSPSVPDHSGQSSAAPLFPPQIGGNGYDLIPALPSLFGATSSSAFHTSGQPAVRFPDFSSDEALRTPATPEGKFPICRSREPALGALQEASAEDQGPQSSEIAPVSPLPGLSAEPNATSQPDTWVTTTEFMSMENYSEWLKPDSQ